jgi:3-oxoacyl-[acyl-carrier protein] reductase
MPVPPWLSARTGDEVGGVAGEIDDRGGHALAIRCDVTHREEVEGMVAELEGAVGPVDLLVNNAGQFGPTGPFAATDPDEWWRALEVNLRGPLYCTRAVLPGMLARGHGRIVNVSSGVGFVAIPMLSAYVVSKTVLYRLNRKSLAPAAGSGTSLQVTTGIGCEAQPYPRLGDLEKGGCRLPLSRPRDVTAGTSSPR